MISVVLCKVSEPSLQKRKSYDGKFVAVKCSNISDGATLSKKFSKGHAQFSKSTQACLSNGLHSADKIKFSLHFSRAVNKRVDKGRYPAKRAG